MEALIEHRLPRQRIRIPAYPANFNPLQCPVLPVLIKKLLPDLKIPDPRFPERAGKPLREFYTALAADGTYPLRRIDTVRTSLEYSLAFFRGYGTNWRVSRKLIVS